MFNDEDAIQVLQLVDSKFDTKIAALPLYILVSLLKVSTSCVAS